MASEDPIDRTRELRDLIASIQRADCTIPRERAVAMAWTLRPDLKPPEPPSDSRPAQAQSPDRSA